MDLKRRITGQLSDVFAYGLIPGLAILVPASLSRWVLRRVTRWQWFMAMPADAAYQGARNHVQIKNEVEWKMRWKQVELLDVRDLYMMLCGRSRSVLGEIECDIPVEIATDRVMIGMHWGPSISILKLLQTAGLNPALPYRPPARHILRLRPFFYLFSTLAARYMVKTMRDRAVPIGGSGKILLAMMDQPGSVFVVMDAPPMVGRTTLRCSVLGDQASFNAGFPAILAGKGKEYIFYAMNLAADGSLRKQLELEGPFKSDDGTEFLQKYAGFLDRHLLFDPAHWRIWHVADQFWREHPPETPLNTDSEAS